MAMKSITAIEFCYFLWNSNVLYVKKFVHFIVKVIFCETGAANELQRSIMYDCWRDTMWANIEKQVYKLIPSTYM